MTKLTKTLWIALAFLTLFGGPRAIADDTVRGRIVEIDKDLNQITITIRGRVHRITPAPNAVVTRDNKRVDFAELQLRDLVRATGSFDSINRKTRVMEAHTIVAAGPKGNGKTARFRGRITKFDPESMQFVLNLGFHNLRVRIVEGQTKIYVNRIPAGMEVLKNGDSATVLGNIQRANDGTFDLIMTAKRIDMFGLNPPLPQ